MNKLPNGWQIKTLSEVCSPSSSNIAFKDVKDKKGDYPIYGASGIVAYSDLYSKEKECIGIVKDGSVGKIFLLPAKSSVISTLNYLENFDNLDIKYLNKLFSMRKGKLENIMTILDEIKLNGLLANYYYAIGDISKEGKIFNKIFILIKKAKNNKYNVEYLEGNVYCNYFNYCNTNHVKIPKHRIEQIELFIQNNINFKYKLRFYFILGEFYFINKNYDKAIEYLKKFLSKNKNKYKDFKFAAEIYLLEINFINNDNRLYYKHIDKLKNKIISEIEDVDSKEKLFKLLARLESKLLK